MERAFIMNFNDLSFPQFQHRGDMLGIRTGQNLGSREGFWRPKMLTYSYQVLKRPPSRKTVTTAKPTRYHLHPHRHHHHHHIGIIAVILRSRINFNTGISRTSRIVQALKSWLSRGFGLSRHLHARFQKSWLSPCFGSSPHLHAYMQTDLTAFLLYAIRRPSRDITMEWPSSRRKRKHTQGFGNREPRCQSSGLLGKLIVASPKE